MSSRLYARYVQDLVAFIADGSVKIPGEESTGALSGWFRRATTSTTRSICMSRSSHAEVCAAPRWSERRRLEVIEGAERFVFKWDPCGSGGVLHDRRPRRTRLRQPKTHTTGRGQEGVCRYCAPVVVNGVLR